MAKTKKRLVITLFLVVCVVASLFAPLTALAADSEYKPRLTAPDSSIPYYSSELNRYFQVGSPMPNCVAYAYGRLYELNGTAPLINHGSAGEWFYINKSGGFYEYGYEPRLGAVACWSNHVAIVEAIADNGDVTISESHWGGGYFDTRTYSDMYSHFGQRFLGYIYAYEEKEPEVEVHDFTEGTEEEAPVTPFEIAQNNIEGGFTDKSDNIIAALLSLKESK